MALRFGLAQINATVGDMRGNADSICRMISSAKEDRVDVIVFPELCICGYPPEDLLHKPKFLKDNETAIIGLAQGDSNQCYNAAAVIQNGQIQSFYQKGQLPNYGVFDEKRYFTSGQTPVIIEKKGLYIAITICEDIWDLDWLDRFLDGQTHPPDLVVKNSRSPGYIGTLCISF
ncbi:MAG: nitrilase-related carbon-nitrogen hydrolase [Planctomycetota bacterium]|jgi:NAD+ synthase (glutamine-hydrolysing)